MVTLLKSHVDGRLLYFVWVGVHSGCDSMVGLDVLVGLVVVLVYFVLMGCSDLCCIGWTLLDWLGFWLCYDGLEDGQGLP